MPGARVGMDAGDAIGRVAIGALAGACPHQVLSGICPRSAFPQFLHTEGCRGEVESSENVMGAGQGAPTDGAS